MRFTPATAALVLAYTSSALAAPHVHARQESTAVVSATAPAATSSDSTNQVPTGLSVTQQLVHRASERFDILRNDEDFKFSLQPGDVPEGKGGVLTAANRKTFPALVGTGAGMAVGTIKPCGINTFHVHPRSAELQMVISGELVTEMVPENGVRPIRNTVGPFEMTPFYQGSVHHQFNPRCEDAVFVAAFAAEDFGTGQVLNEVFELNQDAIVDTFGGSFNGDMIEAIKDKLPESVVLGVETCLRECGGQQVGEAEEGEDGNEGDGESEAVSGDVGDDVSDGIGGETEGDETEGDETEADETEGGDTEADEIEADETVADETEADETEADEIEADEIEADETEADETEGGDIEVDETEEVEEE